MARYYGAVQGGNGEGSRVGHASTGLRVSATSRSEAIHVRLFAMDVGDVEINGVSIVIELNPGRRHTLFHGPIEKLAEYALAQEMLRAA
ncbi:MAG TPA: hypothetical protein VKT73_15265 [Xanthobacteraceae bacterium]|nr:hypothetical protein [Xanthobacteraceae bacterium]